MVVRYSARLNGLDAVALTKLDVLDGLPEVLICTGYRTSDGNDQRFPADLRSLVGAEPVYVRVPGWSTPTKGVTQFDRLPVEAQRYVHKLEELERRGVRDHLHRFGSRRNHRQERIARRAMDRSVD